MAFDVSYIITAIDNFSRTARTICRSIGSLIKKSSSLSKKLEHAGKKLKSLGRSMTMYFTAPIIGAGVAMVHSAANIETMTTQFEVMFHSAKKAGDFMLKLQDFTARTPFRIKGTAEAAQTLLQMGFNAKKIIPTLSMLTDITSGHAEDLGQLSLVYGRVQSKGKMAFRDLYGMVNMQVPIIQQLQKEAKKVGANLSESQIWQAVQQGLINSKLVAKAFKDMTSKGGIFYHHNLKQSKTLAGRWSTFLDRVGLLGSALGKIIADVLDLNGILKGSNDWLENAREKVLAWTKAHKNLSAITKKYRDQIKQILIKIKDFIMAHKKLIAYAALFLMALGPILTVLGAFVITMSLIVSPWTIILGIIIGVGYAIYKLCFNHKSLVEVIKEIHNWWDKLYKKIHAFSNSAWDFLVGLYKICKVVGTVLSPAFKILGKILYGVFVTPLKIVWWVVKKIAGAITAYGHKGINVKQTAKVQAQQLATNQQTFSPIKAAPQKVQSTLDINLKDPSGMVKSISGKSEGDMNYNLGPNMAMATY